MIISLIVAMDESGGIGKDNQIPWHLSTDLKRFKSLTMGHHMIMGRKTYQSIGTHPLPGRTSIVISRQNSDQIVGLVEENCILVHSFIEGVEFARKQNETEVFVIGGGQIFSLALPAAERIYLTQVHTKTDCDTFFPAIVSKQWEETDRDTYPPDEKNQFPFSFINFTRRKAL